jgi:undecaprenyl-diphosphatase
MQIVAAAILGIVQGLTEFLPISSSAHLIIVPWVLGWEPEGLAFDVSLHVGTAAAVIAYFWRDWVILTREVLLGLSQRNPLGNAHRRLGWFIVVGTLPAAAAGLALDKYIEEHLRAPAVPVATLVLFGLLLYLAERWGKQSRNLEQFTWSDALWIGISQAVALIPGVSRSGVTISAALLKHVDRPSAARFSFLLSTPIIVGAGLLEGWRALATSSSGAVVAGAAAMDYTVLVIGTLTSAITGFLCIRYFLRYLRTRGLLPFVIYRFILASVILIMLGVRY